MTRSFVAWNVLDDFDRVETGQVIPLDDRFRGPNPLARLLQQLTRGPRVTQFVCAFTEKAHAAGARVQPGAHSISMFRRTHDVGPPGRRHAADALQRIPNDLA